MAKYLNSDGLAYFLNKLKPLIDAKADKTHTHNYAGSTSAGGSANSVANSLSIQLNGGTATAFNGSAAKSINITASSVGAAASDHTHKYAGSNSVGGAANNSLALNNVPLAYGSTVNYRVPYIDSNSVLEIGKYIDLHWESGENKDYTHRVSLADGIGAIKFEPNDKTNVAAVFSTKNPTSGIGFTSSDGMMGYIAFNQVNGNLKRINNQFNKEYKIYDASNITYGTGNPPATASNGDIYIKYS